MEFTADKSQDYLIFIHGYGGSKCSWSLISKHIPKRYNPIYIELLGFGQSQPPNNFDYSIESQARYLNQLIKENTRGKITIVAHSYGATVLLVSMLKYQFEVNRVILVDALAYPQDIPFFIQAQTIPIISPILSHILPPSFQVDTVLKTIYAQQSQIKQSIRNCYISEFKMPFHREALAKTAKQLVSFKADKYIKRYSQLKSKFYLIWGEKDPLININKAKLLKQDLSARKLIVVPNCGHAPHEECPYDFTKSILSILSHD